MNELGATACVYSARHIASALCLNRSYLVTAAHVAKSLIALSGRSVCFDIHDGIDPGKRQTYAVDGSSNGYFETEAERLHISICKLLLPSLAKTEPTTVQLTELKKLEAALGNLNTETKLTACGYPEDSQKRTTVPVVFSSIDERFLWIRSNKNVSHGFSGGVVFGEEYEPLAIITHNFGLSDDPAKQGLGIRTTRLDAIARHFDFAN
jgi:V8-like Glu-specific endopeptidase